MSYLYDIEKLIKERHSSRTYSDKKVSDKVKQELEAFMKKLDNNIYRFSILDYNLKEGVRLSTYGMIKNAKTFVVAIAKKSLGEDLNGAIDFGYDFEKIILNATDLGLNTCWMGMSYKQDDITAVVETKNDEQIAMVSPIGYSEKIRGYEKITRLLTNADKRKPFGKVFYDEIWDNPLKYNEGDPYDKALEMVRLAPSAGNAQPWRVVKTKEGYDFYVFPKKFYDNMKNKRVDFSYNDMGIAKLHFELIIDKYKLKGKWIKKNLNNADGKRYVYSWMVE